jgi:hypothetical protein
LVTPLVERVTGTVAVRVGAVPPDPREAAKNTLATTAPTRAAKTIGKKRRFTRHLRVRDLSVRVGYIRTLTPLESDPNEIRKA